MSVIGGKYTKDDFKAYEKDLDKRSKLALKDKVKPKQEYPFFWSFYSQLQCTENKILTNTGSCKRPELNLARCVFYLTLA